MASYSKIILVGNVGRDPELRSTPSGKDVTDFSIAVSSKYGDQEQTTWYKVTAWGELAKTVAKYVTKGRPVLVEASRMEAHAYTDKNGQVRGEIRVTANSVTFLGSRPEGNGAADEALPNEYTEDPQYEF